MRQESESVELDGPVGQDARAAEEDSEGKSSVEIDAGVPQDEIGDDAVEMVSEPPEPPSHLLAERLEGVEQAVAQLAADVRQLKERVELIPRQVRQLGTKVDDITESIAQPRIRDLLNRFLLLHDLVEQMDRAPEPETASDQNYRVMRDQIAQVLRVNGITPIAKARCFDPAVHKAVETIPCQTPDEDGEIERVYRTGFRTRQTILRYAEVVVKRYRPPDQAVR